MATPEAETGEPPEPRKAVMNNKRDPVQGHLSLSSDPHICMLVTIHAHTHLNIPHVYSTTHMHTEI